MIVTSGSRSIDVAPSTRVTNPCFGGAPSGPSRLLSPLAVVVGSLLALCAGIAHVGAQAPASAATAVGVVFDGAATFDAAWQAIRETYVDERRTDADWLQLRDEFRPRAAAARSDAEVRVVLRDLLGRIGKSHFSLLPADVHARSVASSTGTAAGDLGIDITPVDGQAVVSRVVPGGTAARAGVRPGWIVERVDGVPLASTDSQGDGSPAADRDGFRLWTTAARLLRGPAGSELSVGFRDLRNEAVSLRLNRTQLGGIPVGFGHLPTFFARLDHEALETPRGRTAQYIRFNVWMTPLAAGIDRAVHEGRGADGMVIDLRQNPGGVLTMVMGVSGHFLPSPIGLGTLRTREATLELVANPRLVAPDGARVEPYAGKLAILVDETSYSASEIFSGGMQAIGRARVFGTRTPGGALPAMLRKLPNGDVLEYAIGDFVTASGAHIEGQGVVPDEIVHATRAALSAGEDPVLAAALRWIDGGQR